MPGALWTWSARRRGALSSDGWVDAVIVEVDGRWFLIDTLVDNPGEELDRDASPEVIGRSIRRWLRDRPRRPGLTDRRPDEEAWATFCEQVVGVAPGELRRAPVLVVCSRGRVFRCATGDDWQKVANEDAAVGSLVRAQLEGLPSRSAEAETTPEPVTASTLEPLAEAGFGPETAWLAVAEAGPDAVCDALGLVDTLPIGVADGIAWAMGEGLVVLPPVDGWTLVAGHDLAVDEAVDVVDLSRRLDTVVQAFRTTATWAEKGAVVREAEPRTEDDVLSLAGEWSVDPTCLPEVWEADASWGRLP
jgi:hypothetical protein